MVTGNAFATVSKSGRASDQWYSVHDALVIADPNWTEVVIRAFVEVGAIPYRERYQVRHV